jgi:2-haloacid dehalogenase
MDRHLLVFDVNETLLDLSGLDPIFRRLFGHAGVRREWFAQVLQTALVDVATGTYHDFGMVARAGLEMVAMRRKVELDSADVASVMKGMRELPPHPEVPAALARLRDAGFRLATLTNSPPDTMEAQLAHAGIADIFHERMSVEPSGSLKPAPTVYRHAARRLGVIPSQMRLVAAHAWDVTGAMRAGCAGAFVARPGMVLDPLGEMPDVVGGDLEEVADILLG